MRELGVVLIAVAALVGCNDLSALLGVGTRSTDGAKREKSLYGPEALAAKRNAELLQEMYRVVLWRKAELVPEFQQYVGSLNQGASLEGVYNGFTHSSDYRQLEMTHSGASADALAAFAGELARFERAVAQPDRFTPASARALAAPVQPSYMADAPEIGFGTPGPAPVHARDYLKTFGGASIFTLKRVLGDAALRAIAEKKADPQALAAWYAEWVVHMCSWKVDFGLPQRNLADLEFHRGWALSNSQDLLTWEVLNRVHRLLNELNREKHLHGASPLTDAS